MKKTVFTGKNAYGLTAGKSGKRCRRKGLALGICAAILGTAGVAGASQAAWAYTESYMDADGKLVIKIYKNGDTDTVTDESDEVTAAEQGNAIESAAEDFTITTVQDGQNPEKKADTEAAENNIAQTRPDLTRIFTFSSLDTVIRAALALNGWYTGTNTLYKDRETTYVLILHQSGMNPEDFNRVCNMLSEYGTGKACTAATEAYFKEHGEILIADQALQQLLLLHV